ncbi:hypothetical protein MKW98_025516 [Papaver atlanticum]|uniref:Uncharacterized protein n=1 Tax=Papaver atlanticum TaxID=357466 RepID=A0AAD4XBY5_9MAGN|nr:hypothetical protein MKW98_025516 [Papaver atlanticum]
MVFNQGLICGRPGNICFALPSSWTLSYRIYTLLYADCEPRTIFAKWISRCSDPLELMLPQVGFKSSPRIVATTYETLDRLYKNYRFMGSANHRISEINGHGIHKHHRFKDSQLIDDFSCTD